MPSQSVDGLRIDERLVSLDVDDRSHGPMASRRRHAIGTASALGRSHLHVSSKAAHGFEDALIVSEHHHLIQLCGSCCLSIDVFDQRTARQLAQRFAGQS